MPVIDNLRKSQFDRLSYTSNRATNSGRIYIRFSIVRNYSRSNSMRPAAFLSIVYIVFLLTQPCADVFELPSERGARPAIESKTWDDCEEGGETCSPFCVCSCCSVPASYQHFSISKEDTPVVVPQTISNFNYTDPFTGSFNVSVWQPPKTIIP